MASEAMSAGRDPRQVSGLGTRIAVFVECSRGEEEVDWHTGFLGKLRIAMD